MASEARLKEPVSGHFPRPNHVLSSTWVARRSRSVSSLFAGENDATLIIKPKPGSKRWQHVELDRASSDQHYTIVFGSHQNSCLKIERNSQECFRVSVTVDHLLSSSGCPQSTGKLHSLCVGGRGCQYLRKSLYYVLGELQPWNYQSGDGQTREQPQLQLDRCRPHQRGPARGSGHLGQACLLSQHPDAASPRAPNLACARRGTSSATHCKLHAACLWHCRVHLAYLPCCREQALSGSQDYTACVTQTRSDPCTRLLQADEAGGLHSAVPSLESLCKTAVVGGMDSRSVCGALSLVDMVAPALDEIAPALVGFLARNLRQALAVAPDSFQALPAALLAELLGNPCLVSFAYPA